MADEWLHDVKPTGAAFASVDSFDWAEVFNPDFYIDAFENTRDLLRKTVSSSKILSEFEKNIIEIGTQTSAFIPHGRAIRVIGKVIVVGKLAKLFIGESEEGGPRKFVGVIDVDVAAANADEARRLARERFLDIARDASVAYTRAGWVVLDPVWLADPKV